MKQKDIEPESLSNTCVDCHRKVHATFTNKELAILYNTLDKLIIAPGIPEWIAFISRKSGMERVATRSANSKR